MLTKTVNELRAAGFLVRSAADAVQCTEVVSDKPFWYFNANFYESMADVHEHLTRAAQHGQQFRLLVAGEYEGEMNFPFGIVEEARYAVLQEARARFVAARNDMSRAVDDYMDALHNAEFA